MNTYTVSICKYENIFKQVPKEELKRRIKKLGNQEKFEAFLIDTVLEFLENCSDDDWIMEEEDMTYEDAVEFCETYTCMPVNQETVNGKELVSCDLQLCKIKVFDDIYDDCDYTYYYPDRTEFLEDLDG